MSTIKTFGPTDDRSFAQLKRCMDATRSSACSAPLGVAMAGRDVRDPHKD